MTRSLYVNLPVKNLQKSMAFFSGLGFEFNQKFSNEQAACMVIAENISAMLLTEEFFKSFIPSTTIADAKNQTEVLLCTNVDSREEVDRFITKAQALGGSTFRAAQDHGFMYAQAFQDLDGHIWEIMWMDPKAMES